MYEPYYAGEVDHGFSMLAGASGPARCLRLEARFRGEREVLLIEITSATHVAGFSKRGDTYVPGGVPARIISRIPDIADTMLVHEEMSLFREPLIDYYTRNVN